MINIVNFIKHLDNLEIKRWLLPKPRAHRDFVDIDEYALQAIKAVVLRTGNNEANRVINLIKCAHDELMNQFKWIPIIMIFQLCMQPLVEAMYILDIFQYLSEGLNGSLWIERIFNQAVSPRSLALICLNNKDNETNKDDTI
ncbi:hypothetical protein GJ496_001695 [Pomphorhynchus laevis]|nr:hypothetical protein GJ496_001695 [Pomphorhynchus laevis]